MTNDKPLTHENPFSHVISADGLTLISSYLTKDNQILSTTVRWKDHETADEMHQVAEAAFEKRAASIASDYVPGDSANVRKLFALKKHNVSFVTYKEADVQFPRVLVKREGAVVRLGVGLLRRGYELVIRGTSRKTSKSK